jgi:glycosyltransferase involved in cell wall biosynthesis
MIDRKICVILPAYNEGTVLNQVLDELTKTPYQIIVVDDGSSDDTYRIAEKYPVHLLRHGCNLGQGAALQTGITYALSLPDTEVIVTFDADGQHHPSQIKEIIQPVLSGKADVALGSRFLRKDSAENISAARRFILGMAVVFTKLTTHLAITDTHNGFRAFSRAGAKKIRITQNGMSHASEILKQIHQEKLVYCEVPVTITYTDYSTGKGQSLLNAINILWDSFFGGLK